MNKGNNNKVNKGKNKTLSTSEKAVANGGRSFCVHFTSEQFGNLELCPLENIDAS